MMMAAYQSTYSIDFMDKGQIQDCANGLMQIFSDYMKTSMAKQTQKDEINMNTVITFLFHQIQKFQDENKNIKLWALKALTKGGQSYTRSEINIAVTQGKNFLTDLAKF